MTESELREIVESHGLTGMVAQIFTRNRTYIGRVGRINVATLILTKPRVIEIGNRTATELTTEAFPGGEKYKETLPALTQEHIAISIDDIEAIAF